MKPSFTCHVVRKTLKAIGSTMRTDHNGHPINATMPDFATMASEEAKREWLAYNLSRKLTLDSEDPAALSRTIENFLARERRNAELNKWEDVPEWVLLTLFRARQICEDIVGPAPDLRRVYRNSVFTGGASTSRKRRMAHPALKWWARPSLEVTPLAYRHLVALSKTSEVIETAWAMPGVFSVEGAYDIEACAFKIVPGSRFDTVDKSWDIRRTILIEPDGNMLLQRGVGITIRDCLRAVGIDLRKQDNNQHFARLGSLNDTWSTLDVRDASNSLYRMLFCMVFPEKWYELLLELRSHICKMPDGTWHPLQMLSSMGNGYTFEIETLLFYCLSKAAAELCGCSERVVVYGDDIIVSKRATVPVVDLFNAIGIDINKEKSFVGGPFRESCGAHFHDGNVVTPLYIRSALETDEAKFLFINQFHYWSTGDYNILPEEKHMDVIRMVLNTLPKRNQIPLEYPDNSGLYSPLYSVVPRHRLNRRGFTVIVFTYLCPIRTGKHKHDAELEWLYWHCSPSSGGGLVWPSALEQIREKRCVLDIRENAPLDLRREGELEYKTVAIPLVGA